MSQIDLHDRVTLHYRLTCGEAVLADTFSGAPEAFQLGRGEMDPRLEYALKGLTAGSHVSLELEPEAAFGSHDPGKVQSLLRADLGAFSADLAIGQRIRFALPNGESLEGEVLAIEADHARIDFNHPLAGRAVSFEVHILEIEKP